MAREVIVSYEEEFYARLYRQNERVMKFGLEAIGAALHREGWPAYPHVLVAGTNGKGQVSALFANAVHLAGMRTGLFTSPHLVEFRERMRVDGRLPDAAEIVTVGTDVLREYGGDDVEGFSGTALTYFECCLVMALRLFARHDVGFGVFEVGLGGRLDATNALHPGMSIVTSIGLDHESYLGHETAQIAREKAGIMRPHCPVVSGRTEVDVLGEEARRRGCLSFDALGRDFDWEARGGNIVLRSRFGELPMHGAETMADFQRDNAAVALFALLRAEEASLIPPVRGILDGLLPHTRWVGRNWPCSPAAARRLGVARIVLDGAHNPDGVRALTDAIAATGDAPRALVVNSCGDKAIESMFPQYPRVFARDHIFVVPVATTPRACSPDAYCTRTGLDAAQACDSLAHGLTRAARAAGPDGTVYVSGSLYLIGEALRELGETACLADIAV